MITVTCKDGHVSASVDASEIEMMADFGVISLALFEECFRTNKKMTLITLDHFLSEVCNIIAGKPSTGTTVRMTGITMMNPLDFFGDSDSDKGDKN